VNKHKRLKVTNSCLFVCCLLNENFVISDYRQPTGPIIVNNKLETPLKEMLVSRVTVHEATEENHKQPQSTKIMH
jgi:hypothetical protein